MNALEGLANEIISSGVASLIAAGAVSNAVALELLKDQVLIQLHEGSTVYEGLTIVKTATGYMVTYPAISGPIPQPKMTVDYGTLEDAQVGIREWYLPQHD
jgi:hypothetical protein